MSKDEKIINRGMQIASERAINVALHECLPCVKATGFVVRKVTIRDTKHSDSRSPVFQVREYILWDEDENELFATVTLDKASGKWEAVVEFSNLEKFLPEEAKTMKTQLVHDLENGKIVRAEIDAFEWVADRVIRSFTRAFGSLQSQNSEFIRAAADGQELARELVQKTAEWDSWQGQWPAEIIFGNAFVTFSSWHQARKLQVVSIADSYKVIIDCAGSPSHTALTGVREELIKLLNGDEKFDLTLTVEVDGVHRTHTVERMTQ